MKTFVVSFIAISLIACSSPSPSQDPPASVDQPTTSSNDDAPAPPVTEATDAGADVATPVVSPPAPTLATCIAACEAKHPASATLNAKLDSTCMLGSCEPVCNGLGTGKGVGADPDAGAVCDTAAANSYPIVTPSAACSTCLATTPACCTLWISIFGSVDGQALNACSNKCYSDFSK